MEMYDDIVDLNEINNLNCDEQEMELDTEVGIKKQEVIISYNPMDMGCADYHQAHVVVDNQITTRIVDIDYSILSPEEIDDIVFHGIGKLLIDEDGLAIYEEITSESNFEVLYDDPCIGVKDDFGRDRAWDDYIDVQESIVQIFKQLRPKSTKRLRLEVEVATEKVAPRLARLRKEIDRSNKEKDRIQNHIDSQVDAGKWIDGSEFKKMVSCKQLWAERARKLSAQHRSLTPEISALWDKINTLELPKEVQSDLWDRVSVLKDIAKNIQGTFSFYSKWMDMESDPESISPYLTWGEQEDIRSEYKTFSREHGVMLEVSDRGYRLAMDHIDYMNSIDPGFATYDNDIVLPRDTVKVSQQRGFKKCETVTDWYCFCNNLPKYSKPVEIAEEDPNYLNSILLDNNDNQ
jgi:hypothetical protein